VILPRLSVYRFLLCLILLGVAPHALPSENENFFFYENHSHWHSSVYCKNTVAERVFLQGFNEDWVTILQCTNDKYYWWMEKNSVKKRYIFSLQSYVIQVKEESKAYEFEQEWIDVVEEFSNPVHIGPPKWMPPELAYWDSYLGDWRYLQPELGVDIFKSLEHPDLMMFWVRYDRDGLGFDATIEVDRFLKILNGLGVEVSGYWTGFFE